jgi:hypothetical protein
MKYYLETTVYSDGTTKNGHYYLSDDKMYMVAYKAPSQTEYKRFKSPIRIDKRGRTFKVVAPGEPDSMYIVKSADIALQTPSKPQNHAIPVTGSNGATYYVTKNVNTYVCTCQGFSFRRKCKHIDSIKEKQNE